jgi:SAM-dependent MidA family methyltransferase
VNESAQARVAQRIRERLAAAGGWLPFDVYMHTALYEPGLGYYSAGAHKFGASGDFTTAPEMSPLFGQCLARHCAGVLTALGGGDVLEIGAGSGRLACDVLVALAGQQQLPGRYLILEISADLRERQRALLATLPQSLAVRVQWLDAPPEEPWQGALLANEVLDALPVECIAWRGGQLLERGVALDENHELCWQERPASAPMLAEVQRLCADVEGDWPSGYTTELCLRTGAWLHEVTRAMSRGVALFIDYGLPRREYYHPQRSAGTLRAHHRHQAHGNPFAHPGVEDLTAWVDFTRVAEGADAAGLEVLGFTTQAALLLGLGIEGLVAQTADERARVARAGEARRLLMPDEMGENFKAIALGRGWQGSLAGFAWQDLRSRL